MDRTPSRPSALKLVVPAASPEVATIAVSAGQTWRLRAGGRWRDGWITCGPNGYRNFLADVLEIEPRVPDQNWFCLIGMLKGRPETAFRIGSGAEHRFDQDGELVVFANDALNRYGGNAGRLTLELELAAPVAMGPPLPPEPTRLFGGGIETLIQAWPRTVNFLDRTAGLAFVAALVMAASLALAFLPQGQDLVRSVAEDALLPLQASTVRQAAFALALLFLALQAWFWPRMIIQSNYGVDRTRWRPRWVLVWTPRLLGIFPFGCTLFALMSAPAPNTGFSLALVLTAALLFLYLLSRRHLEGRRATRRKARGRTYRPIFGRGWALFGLGLAAASFVVAAWDPVAPARVLGAPAVVFLGVGLILPPTVVAIQLGSGLRLPILGVLLGLAALNSLWTEHHSVGRRVRADASAPSSFEQVSLDQAYAAWKRQAPQAPGRPLRMVLVASAGGASRAGFWTGEVLAALHRETGGQLPRSLFAISSVSGGSVGALGYIAALDEAPARSSKAIERRVSNFAGADALSPVVGDLLFSDLPYAFVPVPLLPDRAEALERSWEQSWTADCPDRTCARARLSGPFLNLWRDLKTEWRAPLLIINGASEETGRRILTSKVRFAPGEVDADNFYELEGHDVAASTAIHNGARFPWISPAGRTTSGQHVVDGGYFDPAGVETVRELARALSAAHRNDGLEIMVVVIGYQASLTPGEPGSRAKPRARSPRLLNELAAPIDAIFQSRGGHGVHMANMLQADVGQGDAFPVKGDRVRILLCDAQAPMDWALSDRAQTHMQDLMGDKIQNCPGNAEALNKVKTFLQYK